MNLSYFAQAAALSLTLLINLYTPKAYSAEIPPIDQQFAGGGAPEDQESQMPSIENLTPLETLELAERKVDALIERIEAIDLQGELQLSLSVLKDQYDSDLKDENDSFDAINEEIDRAQPQQLAEKFEKLQQPTLSDYWTRLDEISNATAICKQRATEMHAIAQQDLKAKYKSEESRLRQETELQRTYFENVLADARGKKQQIKGMRLVANREKPSNNIQNP